MVLQRHCRRWGNIWKLEWFEFASVQRADISLVGAYGNTPFLKINTVGGSPTASHFFLLRQRKSNQKEGDPNPPPLRGSLRCSTGQAAAELALRAQTVLAEIP
jgi:hypothetical protein